MNQSEMSRLLLGAISAFCQASLTKTRSSYSCFTLLLFKPEGTSETFLSCTTDQTTVLKAVLATVCSQSEVTVVVSLFFKSTISIYTLRIISGFSFFTAVTFEKSIFKCCRENVGQPSMWKSAGSLLVTVSCKIPWTVGAYFPML